MRHIVTIFVLISTTGCSVYQSDSRKFLEKQALEYAGVAAYLEACNSPTNGDWILTNVTDDGYSIFTDETKEFRVQVSSLKNYSCSFKFSSAQEMIEQTDSAIELTALYQSLGEFALRPMSHIK